MENPTDKRWVKKMDDGCCYQIRIQGSVAEEDINTTSPLRLMLEREENGSTYFSVCADQSSLVGLIRHLHGLGFVLQSIIRAGLPE